MDEKNIKKGEAQATPEEKTPPSEGKEAEELSKLKEELEKKEREIQELKDKYLRALAEMDNFRKRAARDQAEAIKYANEKLLTDLLSVIDNIERAILHSKEKKDFEALINGLELTLKEFNEVVAKYGLKTIEALGQPFDPTRHHAVSLVETEEHEDNMVVEEFRKGYILNDRVLRPSLVGVTKRKEITGEVKEEGTD